MQRVYLHGGGRTGREAWPTLDASAGAFLAFDKDERLAARVTRLEHEFGDEPIVVFAHSLGGVTAALATQASRLDVRALVLIEPALYDIVRGTACIERHIAIHSEARAQAADGNLPGYWMMVRPVMFGGEFEPERWDEERPLALLWSQAETPWGHGIRADMVTGIPTLVVTGAWNEEYEAIAATLVAGGAEHRVLAGAGHRPQDLPGFAALCDEFLSRFGV